MLQNGDFSGSFWVKNLFEEEYFTYGIDIRALGYDYLVQGESRTFGMRFEYRY